MIYNNVHQSKESHTKIYKKTNNKEQDVSSWKIRKKVKIKYLTVNENWCTQDFIVDWGSTSHMANSKQMFSVLEDICKYKHSMAKKNGRMNVEEKGNIEASSYVLTNFLYFLNSKKNLLCSFNHRKQLWAYIYKR